MSETNKPVFKTQLNGYNKQNVNQYILEMNSRFTESENEYRAEAEKLKLAVQSSEEAMKASADAATRARAELVELEAKLNEASQALDSANERLAELEQTESSLRDEIARLESALSDANEAMLSSRSEAELAHEKANQLEAELKKTKESASAYDEIEADALREQIKALSAQNSTLSRENAARIAEIDELNHRLFEAESALSESAANEAAQKAEMYDKMTSKLGSIMLNANTNAELVVSDAEKKAAEIIAAAERKAGELTVSAGINALNASEAINDEIKASMQSCIDELMTELDSLQYQLASVLGNLGSRGSDINSRLDYYKHSLTEAIESKLAELK